MIESNADIVLDSRTAARRGCRPPGRAVRRRGRAPGPVAPALAWLEQHAEAINALNVFPVPDGDTGTNMVLTLRAAVAEAERLRRPPGRRGAEGGRARRPHGRARQLAASSFPSCCEAWPRPSPTACRLLTPELLADAFVAARDTAYQGVMRPVEGTILTVAKEVAAATVRAARNETHRLPPASRRRHRRRAPRRGRHAHASCPCWPMPASSTPAVRASSSSSRACTVTPPVWGSSTTATSTAASTSPPSGPRASTATTPSSSSTAVASTWRQIREALSRTGRQPARRRRRHRPSRCTSTPTARATRSTTASPLGSVGDVVVENMQEQYQTFIAHRAAERVATATPSR